MRGGRLSMIPRIGAVLGLLALNACGSSGDEGEDFEYGKADMESAFHGAYIGIWTPKEGTPSAFELEIRAPDEPGVRMTCNNRTFSESGPALSEQCSRSSELRVSATAVIAGLEGGSVDLDGSATVHSLILSQADLYLSREGAPFRLNVSWDSEQGFTHCSAFADDGASVATCTLDEPR